MSDKIIREPSLPAENHPETLRLTALLADPIAAPADCADDELMGIDFSRLDALVGTVRSDEQFEYCLRERVYYVPARTVAPETLPVAVIALYEEGLSRRAGIKRYGKVTETHVVKRSEIPVPMSRNNPDETYYLFPVSSWQYLDTPIALAGTTRGKPMLTSQFLLTHCRRSYQLAAIRSPEEYRLCQLLCRLEEESVLQDPLLRRVGARHILSVSEGQLRLLDATGRCLFGCPVSALETSPAEVLRRVAEGLGL